MASFLESVRGLADEIIIADTGSSDKTIEIAKQFGCKVLNFEQKEGQWIDGAMNLALENASKDWVLILAPDERISEIDFKNVKILTESKEYAGYYLIQRQYNNDVGIARWISSKNDGYPESKVANGWYEVPALRLFINDKRIKSAGIPHDIVDDSVKAIGKTCLTNIPIHHYGELNRKGLGKAEKYIGFLTQFAEQPNNKEKFFTYYQIACEYLGKKDLTLAEEYLKKSIELNGEYFLSLFSLGSLYLKQAKLDEAEKLLLKASGIKQTSEVYNNLGIIYSEKKEINRAIKKFERAIELNKESADANFNLGLAHLKSGKENKARSYFERAIELNPEYKKRVSFN